MKTSFKLGILTLLIFGIGGILLIEFVQDKSFIQVLQAGKAFHLQVIIGLVAGIGASTIAVGIISRKFFDQERSFYDRLISRWNLTYGGMVFVSLCAGIGDELFFRGGVQPLIGIWWTSILFVLLHGYLNPRNWRISLYGGVMVCIIAGFGYLFRFVGLFSAMIAHSVLDIMLFGYMSRKSSR